MDPRPSSGFAQTVVVAAAAGAAVKAEPARGYLSPRSDRRRADDSADDDDDGSPGSPGSVRNGDGNSDGASPAAGPAKKKQKRNKPTLSCFECVERKTKASSAGAAAFPRGFRGPVSLLFRDKTLVFPLASQPCFSANRSVFCTGVTRLCESSMFPDEPRDICASSCGRLPTVTKLTDPQPLTV